jgi:hypothetical protein
MPVRSHRSTYSGTEFIDNIGNVFRGMEVNVSWAVGLARAQTRGHVVHFEFDYSVHSIIVKLTDQILAQVWYGSSTSACE